MLEEARELVGECRGLVKQVRRPLRPVPEVWFSGPDDRVE